MIATEAKIEMDGEVLEALGGGMFRVKLDNGHELIAYTAGKMRRYRIRMAPGDRISVQVSTYDLSAAGSSTGTARVERSRRPSALFTRGREARRQFVLHNPARRCHFGVSLCGLSSGGLSGLLC